MVNVVIKRKRTSTDALVLSGRTVSSLPVTKEVLVLQLRTISKCLFLWFVSHLYLKKTTLSTQGDLIWMLKINLFPNWTSETRAGERSVPLVGDKNMCLYKEAAMPLYMKNTLYLPPPTRISNPVLNFKKYPERKQLQYNPSQAAQVSAIQQKSYMNSFLFPVSWYHNVMKPHGYAALGARGEAAMFTNLLSTSLVAIFKHSCARLWFKATHSFFSRGCRQGFQDVPDWCRRRWGSASKSWHARKKELPRCILECVERHKFMSSSVKEAEANPRWIPTL